MRGRLPVLALVGRPNVGKSTLFNRLLGERKAIVDDLPGVTRDRNYGEAAWDGKGFFLIDTGGFAPDPGTGLEKQIQEQGRLAIEEADVILFLFDGKEGLNPADREAVHLLRQVAKPVFFAANKIDTRSKESSLYEFYSLGLSEVFPLSAEHGLGLSELMDRISDSFPAAGEDEAEEDQERGSKPLSLAIVGRPNVGKSTLVNRLLGNERSVVDASPGTTRDALDTPFLWGGKRYLLVDTAGIRRKAKIVDRIERYSVIRSLGSVDRGDLIVYLLDGPEGVTSQDGQVLSYASRRGKGLVLAVNKWDLVAQERAVKSFGAEVYRKLSFVDFAPLVFISALTGHGTRDVMEAVERVAESYHSRVQTARLNQVLRDVMKRHSPPVYRGREVKIYYTTQTATAPPAFMLFANLPAGILPDYQRYLVHQLRRALGLEGTPIRLVFRGREDRGRVKRTGGRTTKDVVRRARRPERSRREGGRRKERGGKRK